MRAAEIVDLANASMLAKQFREQGFRIVCTSGGYDPIHPGHVTCINESATFGNKLFVIVNGDYFLKNKKQHNFMDIDSRCRVVAGIKGVDYVVKFDASNPSDMTVCEALAVIRPHVFTKGGDREPSNIPEWHICQLHNISVAYNVGEQKRWSSSQMLIDWKNKS